MTPTLESLAARLDALYMSYEAHLRMHDEVYDKDKAPDAGWPDPLPTPATEDEAKRRDERFCASVPGTPLGKDAGDEATIQAFRESEKRALDAWMNTQRLPNGKMIFPTPEISNQRELFVMRRMLSDIRAGKVPGIIAIPPECDGPIDAARTERDKLKARVAELEDHEAKGQKIYQNAVANNEHFAKENLRLVNERDSARAEADAAKAMLGEAVKLLRYADIALINKDIGRHVSTASQIEAFLAKCGEFKNP